MSRLNPLSIVIKNVALFSFLVSTAPSCNYKPVLSFNFDSDLEQPHVQRILHHNLIELDDNEGIENSNAIKVSYVGYPKGSKIVSKILELPSKLQEATLNYNVKFEEGFNFVIGGKLLGFIPEKRIVGGHKMQPDGWSARANFKKDGKMASYVYHQNKIKKWGDGITSENIVLTPGTYNDVAIYVKLNNPITSNNGIFQIWVDGKLIISHDNFQYRKVDGPNTLISSFYFATFHGGSSEKFAPKDSNGNFTTEYAWFDNIEIYEGKYIRSIKK